MNEPKVRPKRRRSIARAVEALAAWGLVVGCTTVEPSSEVLPSFQGGGGVGQSAISPDGLSGSSAFGGGANTPACTGIGCACPAGQTSCSGSLLGGQSDQTSCVDTSLDVANCGGCGNVCAPGQVCFGSACSDECGGGLAECNSTCVNTTTDALNCGGCGLQCSGGAGQCNAGRCPTGKACALTTSVSTPKVADFETYTSGAPADMFGFAFNAAPGSPLAVYAGPYQYSDGTGAQALSMVPGSNVGGTASNFAVSISNTGSTAWGGALGFWMGCIDASSFDGIAFSARGQVPGGVVTLATGTESTSAPAEDDPAAGGTCLADCVSPSIEFPVAANWQRVLLPWSAFAPGSANQTSVPATGDGVTGLTFSVALEWAEDANNPGVYGPAPANYELAVDDIEFFKTAEVCPAGQQICDSTCVDVLSNNDHCGACGAACGGGSVCTGAEGCVCPGGLTFCAGSCVDVQTDSSHCGACGNFCVIGAECSGAQCEGGNATTSNRCGETTRLLGNPLGCDFGWGANPDNAIPGFVDFASKWVGYEPNINTRCDGCDWLRSYGGNTAVPVYIAYFTAYRANIEDGLGDCNLDFDNNLCSGGAQWIRDNRARLISTYESYAQRSYAVMSDRPVVWIVEPDFSQYAEPDQSNPLSMAELGALAVDIMCAIKSNMPNAVIALNHSTWLAGADFTNFWNAMPLDLIDMLHVTSSANVPGGYFNNGDANDRQDGTFAFLNQRTGKPIIADTSFGITTMQDSWSTASVETLNDRIGDGVAGVLIYPTPGDYQQRINAFDGQLNSTCQ